MATPLVGTESGKNAIQRVTYTHDAMIDTMIARPSISQGELAAIFGLTQNWISRVMGSDAFQKRLAERKTELIDPQLLANVELQLEGLARQSIEVIQNRLADNPKDTATALEALKITTKSLGYGVRQDKLTLQQSFVVALPQQSASASEWAQRHGGSGETQVIDITPKE